MKTLIMMSSALAVAGFMILCQQRTTLGRDEFQLIHHQSADYKVFSYGFPWRVNDCDAALATVVTPPPQQTTLRTAGNFLFFAIITFAAFQLLHLVYERLRMRHEARMYLKQY